VLAELAKAAAAAAAAEKAAAKVEAAASDDEHKKFALDQGHQKEMASMEEAHKATLNALSSHPAKGDMVVIVSGKQLEKGTVAKVRANPKTNEVGMRTYELEVKNSQRYGELGGEVWRTVHKEFTEAEIAKIANEQEADGILKEMQEHASAHERDELAVAVDAHIKGYSEHVEVVGDSIVVNVDVVGGKVVMRTRSKSGAGVELTKSPAALSAAERAAYESYVAKLEQQMRAAAGAMDYARAQVLKDQVDTLKAEAAVAETPISLIATGASAVVVL
jgi:outer membrane lipopolysaccharide assembly protein LptE/RlpB